MPKFDLEIPHGLPAAEVKTRLASATEKLESKYKATCAWASERELKVTRSGLDARVMIEDARVRVEMSLGLLLTPMAGAIKAGLTRELTSLLTPAAP